MGGQSRTAEEKLARIAGSASGIVTRAEALEAGLTRREIERRIEKGLLIPEFPGVYRVGHTAGSVEARYTAAVKACGEGAVLMGLAAAYLLGLVKGTPPSPAVLTRTERRVKGIRTCRSRHIDPRDVTKRKGIAVTTVPRTLCDLAGILSLPDLARACHEAGVKYGTKPGHVAAVLERRPNTPGVRNLRLVMVGDEPALLSKMEEIFFERLRAEKLPLPITNKPAGGRRVDCRWPKHKVTVELQSYGFHNSRHAWEQDHVRRREARRRGDRFRTYTWHDVAEDPTDMLAELRELLRG